MKSLLLGSAATLVVVAGAQAADLPTKKGAPAAEYVKVCKIGDIAGFILPGSDTCLKISGYVNAQIEGGNVKDHYATPFATLTDIGYGVGGVTLADRQDSVGYYIRGEVDIQAVSNTAYGPLLSYIGLRGDLGGGFDSERGQCGWSAAERQRLRRRRRLCPVGGDHRRRAPVLLRLPDGRRDVEGPVLA